MHFAISKTKTAAIFVIVLLMASITLMAMPVQAQITQTVQPNGAIHPLPAGVTPDTFIQPHIYLSLRPTTVGVGQTMLINLWNDPGPSYSRYFTDYKVTFTKPDGTTYVKTINSYPADGTAWFEYAPDQVGTWTAKFEFPGGYFAPGNYTVPIGSGTAYDNYTENYNQSVWYYPSETPVTNFTVQADYVLPWPSVPLPTDYWTRPVLPENREWYVIAGNYPWYGPGGGPTWDALYPKTAINWNARQLFTPWVQAPNTAHIAWTRLDTTSAGIIGGDNGYNSISGSGVAPDIIYNGYAYSTLTKAMETTVNGTTRILPVSVWECTDIRTGEVRWDLTPVTAPTAIEYTTGSGASVPGAEANFGVSASLIAISGGRLIKYNPSTGAVTLNISLAVTSGTYYMNGYALTVQTINATTNNYRLINWTTLGTSTNFTTRIA